MIDEDSDKKPPALQPDLDRLSIDELEDRVRTLEAEIAACRAAIRHKRDHLSDAENLFRR